MCSHIHIIIVLMQITLLSGCDDNPGPIYERANTDVVVEFTISLPPTGSPTTAYRVYDNDDTAILQVRYQNGTATVTENGVTFTGDADTGVITFIYGEIPRSKAGQFRIRSVQGVVIPEQCVILYILGVPTTPAIKISKSPDAGGDVTLTCNGSTSTTSPTGHGLGMVYSWTIDGVINPVNRRYTYTNNRNQVTVSSVVSSDAGKQFTCTATENVTKGLTSAGSAQMTFSVYYGPDNIRFNPAATVYEKAEGTTMGPIRCIADCFPNCTYMWTNLGQSAQIGNGGILNLGTLRRSDEGSYRCTAINSNRTGRPEYMRTKDLAINVTIQVTNVTLYTEASVTVSGQEIQVAYGMETTLTCTPGTSRPEATIVWYIGTVKQTTTGTVFTFTPTYSDHDQNIYCKAYNTQPENQAVSSNSPRLYVRGAPRPSDTAALVTNITRALHDNVTLSMTVIAYPAPSSFIWSKLTGGSTYTPVIPGHYINILTQDRRSDLIITDIQEEHFGQYKLKVDNGIGTALTQVFFVSKQDRPEAPTEFQPLHETTTESTITIQWTPGYNGGLPQTFYVLYRPYSSDTWNVENKPEPATNITLTALAAGMKYEAQIYSQNVIGKSYIIGPNVFITLGKVNTCPTIQDTVPLIIGAYAGGLFTAVVIVIAVLLMWRFNIVTCNKCNRKETTQRKASSKPNEQLEYVNTAILTTDEYENEIMLEAIKGDNAYETTAPVNKTEHLYSDIGPSSSSQEKSADKGDETEESMEAYVNV